MAPKAKVTNEKVGQLDFHTVRGVMKRHNYPLDDVKHARHLRGKMLASIRTWEKEY